MYHQKNQPHFRIGIQARRRPNNQWIVALIVTFIASIMLPAQSAIAQSASVQSASIQSASIQSISAQSGEVIEVGMEVHLDFYQDVPRAIWTVRAQKSVGGVEILNETRHIPLSCTAYGVDIMSETATFRSADHDFIKCLLPSFAAEIGDMSNGEIIVGEHCDCKTPWIAANVELEYEPASSGPLADSNPLLYHDDMHYAVPFVDPPNLAALRTEYAGAPQPTSSPFYLDAKNPWNAVWSGEDGVDFLANADLTGWASYLTRYALSSIKNALHWTNGTQLDQATGAQNNFTMGTGTTVLFFGVNPDTGSFFNGSVKQIDWDPGCRGIGG